MSTSWRAAYYSLRACNNDEHRPGAKTLRDSDFTRYRGGLSHRALPHSAISSARRCAPSASNLSAVISFPRAMAKSCSTIMASPVQCSPLGEVGGRTGLLPGIDLFDHSGDLAAHLLHAKGAGDEVARRVLGLYGLDDRSAGAHRITGLLAADAGGRLHAGRGGVGVVRVPARRLL